MTFLVVSGWRLEEGDELQPARERAFGVVVFASNPSFDLVIDIVDVDDDAHPASPVGLDDAVSELDHRRSIGFSFVPGKHLVLGWEPPREIGRDVRGVVSIGAAFVGRGPQEAAPSEPEITSPWCCQHQAKLDDLPKTFRLRWFRR